MAPGSRNVCFPVFLRKLVGLLVFVCNGIIILTGNIVRQECMDRLPLLQDKHCVAMIAGVGSCGHVYGGATAPAETEGDPPAPGNLRFLPQAVLFLDNEAGYGGAGAHWTGAGEVGGGARHPPSR